MSVKRLVAVIFAITLSLHAAAPPRGSDRLRELVVFPQMNLSFNFGLNFQGSDWVISKNMDLPSEIGRLQKELEQQPDESQQLLQLGNLLDSNGQTNESRACYQKVEQLCRNKADINPQDGLNLTDLGAALRELGKRDEAENVYRKATLVSSNDWKCWVRLGNFLGNQFYFLLFPENLRDQIAPAQVPSQAVLDYRPPAAALEKSEALCNEASRCFGRAVSLAPKEPEVFFQRAGYMSVSNLQNCFFRHYRDNEQIDSKAWLLTFFSKETIANLQQAADLRPNDSDDISLAAYFEWVNAMMQGEFSSDALPDTPSHSILAAMTRLENLSQSSDKKLAAEALENLGVLNMFFKNSQAATANFRQAVSLDPSREQSWDLWLGSIADSATPEEKVAVCESRLKNKNSARNHLFLARAFEHQKKWDKAGEQAEAALKIEPDNLIAHLELAALDLKQSADTNFMNIVSEQLFRAGELIKKSPTSDETRSRWREMMLNFVINCGLENTPEYNKIARAYLDEVLQHYPNDKQAKEISTALN